MPRVSALQRSVVNLMDEYSVCLATMLRLDTECYDSIKFLNAKIHRQLAKLGIDREKDTLSYENARMCVIAFLILTAMDKVYKRGANFIEVWCALSQFPNEFNAKVIKELKAISQYLSENTDVINYLLLTVKLKPGQVMRTINLIETPFSPLLLLNQLCQENIIHTKWKAKIVRDDTEPAVFRAWSEREFMQIADLITIASSSKYHFINSNENDVQINGEKLEGQTIMLMPHHWQTELNHVNKVKIETFYHKLISWHFNGMECFKLTDFKLDFDLIEFCSPDNNYSRELILHKGKLIGIFGAIYAQFIYQVENKGLDDAIHKAYRALNNLDFYCEESTIRRVRQSHLKIFKGSAFDS